MLTVIYSRFHKTFAKIFQILFQSSQVHCEVQKFILRVDIGLILKQIRRAEQEYMNIHTPINALISPLLEVYLILH